MFAHFCHFCSLYALRKNNIVSINIFSFITFTAANPRKESFFINAISLGCELVGYTMTDSIDDCFSTLFCEEVGISATSNQLRVWLRFRSWFPSHLPILSKN